MKNLKLIPGSTLGGTLLISGSCIGAGMLGVPVLVGLLGFWPSLILLFFAFAFMTFTGLLLVEINGWFHKRVNLISMVDKSLGKPFKIVSWVLYLFLFYSLLVAYISGSGSIISSYVPFLSSKISSIFFVIIFALVIYFGTKPVDFVNRIFMFGLIASYFAMIFFGINKIDLSLYSHVNFKYFLLPIAVLITSFGFHNVIPSLTAYMKGDLKRVKKSILLGSLLALIIYLVWIILVLGIVPVNGSNGLLYSYKYGKEATIALKNIVGISKLTFFAQGFALFAIVTSFLAQGLSLMHFIADGIKVNPDRKHSMYLIILALLPPSIFAFSYPTIFFKALSFAGAYCAVILFGIFPALMAYIGRYIKKETSAYHVKGGKLSLYLVIFFSLIIIINEIFNSFIK
ncbi:MAG: Tyrosine-specific transport protein [Candidatus Anoxychlamydiales bacterium]|nr:Tyrosine-specific transport protein [Candidatus Anoxychlamydiales bacterium]